MYGRDSTGLRQRATRIDKEYYCRPPKCQGCRSLPCIHEPNRLQNYVAANRQRLRAQLVDRILHRVMEDVVVAIVQIDNVHRRNANLHEWQVIVLNASLVSVEVRLVAQVSSRLVNESAQPWR